MSNLSPAVAQPRTSPILQGSPRMPGLQGTFGSGVLGFWGLGYMD